MKKYLILGLLAIIIVSVFTVTYRITTNKAQLHASPGTQYGLDVWWPIPNRSLSATQTLKAMVPDLALSDYVMHWQVDDGQLNVMNDSNVDYPHKEVSIDVTRWKWNVSGVYTFNFVARNKQGAIISQQKVPVNISSGNTQVITPQAQAITPTPVLNASVSEISVLKSISSTKQSAPVTNTDTASSGNPMAGAKLYVNPNSEAKKIADSWRTSKSYEASKLDKIANQPEVQWFGGWNSNIEADVQKNVQTIKNAGAMPVMVAYNIPQRDCGGYSAGGSSSPEAYKQWINSFARGIGNAKAVVIIEPDAIAGMDCLSQTDRQTRLDLLRHAVITFKRSAATAVYIDAGHAGWISVDTMKERLVKAGIELADGFSLNVSNFISTDNNAAYGTSISKLLNNKHFIIDTGRNGNGPTTDYQWCNPSGRALGINPTVNTGNSLIDAYLWIKPPGGSDGNCNGGPSAGVFWPEYAVGLAARAQ